MVEERARWMPRDKGDGDFLKSKYESHVEPYLDKIAAWAERGATAQEIAGKLHVAYSTFRKYLDAGKSGNERYMAMAAAFVRACEVPDDAVEAALFRRACGIEYEERTFEQRKDPDSGEYVELCTKRVTKFTPPDPTSAMFWLANRRRDRWAYRPGEEKTDGDMGGVVVLAEVMAVPPQLLPPQSAMPTEGAPQETAALPHPTTQHRQAGLPALSMAGGGGGD